MACISLDTALWYFEEEEVVQRAVVDRKRNLEQVEKKEPEV